MAAGNSRAVRIFVAGTTWPLETFLVRLVRGLMDSGLEVTIGSAKPKIPNDLGFRLSRVTSWDDSVPRRLFDIGVGWARGQLLHREDHAQMRRKIETVEGWMNRVRRRHQLLPYMGKRWDVLYFPWMSAAVEHLPIYGHARSVIVSCRGTQVNVAPHSQSRADLTLGMKCCFEASSRVHCVSDAMLESACGLGLDRRKAVVIRPAVDPDHFRPRARIGGSQDVLSVVCVGGLGWIKGHEWALIALRKCLDRGLKIRLQLIGDGSDRDRLRYTIEDLQLLDHVQMLGRLPVERVAEVVRESDVFLLPSISEGISNAALEAMACGLPVITTDCGGMREAVRDGVDGFVVPICDAEGIAKALELLGKSEHLRMKMGESARARVCESFHLKGQIARWVELLSTCAVENQQTGASVAS